ncbi:MAG TPA: CopG family transcriptional regulator [Ideonella sp.]|uniref:CopG family transcriptional regulator n=1 Tax=Ideonella sp. TaxID=1929293 RepID=UPI002E368C76|nr:CopG family transcriptional regulator [Ideonella sp.]HEX5683143.1 CopG family transcriptional regulator [Ideonella sp.]
MELKTARLTLLIDPNKKAAFEHLCSQLDLTPSQVVRQLIRDYLAQHGMTYTPSGQDMQDARAADAGRGGAAKATKATRSR